MTDAASGFGIYVHWPFCQSKCPYCDFNSHVAHSVDQRSWAKAFVRELERYSRETGERAVNSVFFGGGTPSLMEPELVETVLGCIEETWALSRDAEITLEANPSSVEAHRFRDYQAAGVNRLSLGIQALNDGDLKRLGRLHSSVEALKALEIAQKNFHRVSFDLIYARQGQSLTAWEDELSRALSFGTEHLSLYQLTIEDGTAFDQLHKSGNLRDLPSDDLSADMYVLTQELCEARGMAAYEVSNHARPGAYSRHNMIYWQGGDYIGIGPGAHGRLTLDGARFATETDLSPEAWKSAALSGSGEAVRVSLSERDRVIEYLMMGLRLKDGISVSKLGPYSGTLLNSNNINKLRQMNYIQTSNDRIWVTPNGRIVLNAVIRSLFDEIPVD